MRRSLFILVTSFWTINVSAQLEVQTSRSAALGGNLTMLSQEDAILANFANTLDYNSVGVVLSTDRRFSLQELSTYALGAVFQLKSKARIGFSIAQYGFDEYSESEFKLKYARKLYKNFSLAADLGYRRTSVFEHGSVSKPIFGLSFSGVLSGSLSYGGRLSNPIILESDNRFRPLTRIILGVRYLISTKVKTYLELDKHISEPLNIKLGLEYQIHPEMQLLMGYNTGPGSFGLGISLLHLDKFKFDVSAEYNIIFGLSPYVTCRYRLHDL